MIRHQGTITTWKDERGFGFIAPRGGGPEVFVHIREFPCSDSRPSVGDRIIYELGKDEKGRLRALSVDWADRPSAGRPLSREDWLWIAVPLAFLGLFSGWLAWSRAPMAIAIYAFGISLLTYLVFGLDKCRAETGVRRIPENSLHLLALAGGWPGAILAQRLLRHKLRKRSFMAVFWVAVAASCVLSFLLLTPTGSSVFRSFWHAVGHR